MFLALSWSILIYKIKTHLHNILTISDVAPVLQRCQLVKPLSMTSSAPLSLSQWVAQCSVGRLGHTHSPVQCKTPSHDHIWNGLYSFTKKGNVQEHLAILESDPLAAELSQGTPQPLPVVITVDVTWSMHMSLFSFSLLISYNSWTTHAHVFPFILLRYDSETIHVSVPCCSHFPLQKPSTRGQTRDSCTRIIMITAGGICSSPWSNPTKSFFLDQNMLLCSENRDMMM